MRRSCISCFAGPNRAPATTIMRSSGGLKADNSVCNRSVQQNLGRFEISVYIQCRSFVGAQSAPGHHHFPRPLISSNSGNVPLVKKVGHAKTVCRDVREVRQLSNIAPQSNRPRERFLINSLVCGSPEDAMCK